MGSQKEGNKGTDSQNRNRLTDIEIKRMFTEGGGRINLLIRRLGLTYTYYYV